MSTTLLYKINCLPSRVLKTRMATSLVFNQLLPSPGPVLPMFGGTFSTASLTCHISLSVCSLTLLATVTEHWEKAKFWPGCCPELSLYSVALSGSVTVGQVHGLMDYCVMDYTLFPSLESVACPAMAHYPTFVPLVCKLFTWPIFVSGSLGM